MIRTRVGEIRETSRNTLGVRIIRLDEGDSVGSLALVPEEAIEAAQARALEEDANRVDLPEADIEADIDQAIAPDAEPAVDDEATGE